MHPILSVRGLSKIYGKQTILHHIDIDIPKASIFALLGPNGSGKTTFLKSVLGIVHPSSFESISETDKNRMGYMPQQPNFPPNMRIFVFLELVQNLRKQPGIHLEHLLTVLGIQSFCNKSMRELSGGMRQKVNIAQAFMFDNSLFLLDEPTLGLDPHATFLFKTLVKERRQNGATVLMTSHIMTEVEELADRLALLVDGRIHLQDSPQAIKAQAKTHTLEQALHHYWIEKYENIQQ
jgi:Cu-processing system ATP-binding protein